MRQWLRYAAWLLPHGVHVLRHHLRSVSNAPTLVSPDVLAANADLRDRHAGQRCFIVGNGPTVRQVDLRSLQGETVFSVSNGYLHDNYAAMSPAYHCVPQITYGVMKEADVVDWFCEMDRSIGPAELFLNETEAALVHRHGLFRTRRVHYLALQNSFDELDSRDVIDIAGPIPRVESVPVMALLVAMYLGFRKIIIIGVDHDSWRTGYYNYAFEPKSVADKDVSVASNGKIVTPNFDTFQSLARLWRQYRCLGQIAAANQIEILNAGHDGELDEFPRRSFESLGVRTFKNS
jgi:hypothetical protein